MQKHAEFKIYPGAYLSQMAQIEVDGLKGLSISQLMMHRLVIKHPDVPSEVWRLYETKNFDSSDGIAIHPDNKAKLVNFYELPADVLEGSRQSIPLLDGAYEAIEKDEFNPHDLLTKRILPLADLDKNHVWDKLATSPVLKTFLEEYASKRYDSHAMGIYETCLETGVPIWVPWTLAEEVRYSCIGAFESMDKKDGIILAANQPTIDKLEQTFNSMYKKE